MRILPKTTYYSRFLNFQTLVKFWVSSINLYFSILNFSIEQLNNVVELKQKVIVFYNLLWYRLNDYKFIKSIIVYKWKTKNTFKKKIEKNNNFANKLSNFC